MRADATVGRAHGAKQPTVQQMHREIHGPFSFARSIAPHDCSASAPQGDDGNRCRAPRRTARHHAT
jgi:hypothetical protein